MAKKLLVILLLITLVIGITSCSILFPNGEGNPPTGEGEGEETPPAGEENPPAGEENPPAGEENPPVDEENPPVGEENPPAGEENPPAGEENPPAGDNNDDDNKEEAVTIKSISISNIKTEFAFGEELDTSSMVVTATMSNKTKKTLTSNDYTVTCDGYNSMKPGTYKVTVTANNTNHKVNYNVILYPAESLKVLMIGNSFADDTINYAYEIAKSAGIPVENILIADIYIGGCSISTHWKNAQSNEPAYRFGLEKEGYFDGSSYTGWTMKQAIEYAEWDYITFQQNSGNSGGRNSYANLQNLMDYVYGIATDTVNNPNANPNVKFAWHQTWAYQQNSTSSAFATYGNDQMTMFNAIMSCLETEVLTKDFVAIIPNGTAIQNARTSFIGDTFSRDQHNHLSHDAGRYIAAMGLVGTLTGRDMTAITWKPTDSGFSYPMSEEVIEVCKESWKNAMESPFEITKSKYPPADGPAADDPFNVFEGNGTKESPYLIQNADDMWTLSTLTAGKSYGDSSIYFKLTADINLSADNWNPICASASTGWVTTPNSFNANFDGNGKTITFVGNYTGDSWAKGLFSAVGGHVHDLTLRGEINIEKGRVGSLASMAMGGAKIENITSYVNITSGNNQVGGIIGYVNQAGVKITNCVNYGNLQGRQLVGGILGGTFQDVCFTNCVNNGRITATAQEAGGIVSEKYASTTLVDCQNNGVITAGGEIATANEGTESKYVGYLVGHVYG